MAGSARLSTPLYGATPGQAITRFFRKYATFSGRASRSEYWWVALAIFVVSLVPMILIIVGMVSGVTHVLAEREPITMGTSEDSSTLIGYSQPGILADPTAAALLPLGSILILLIRLATLVPELAIAWRRLHDANLPGPLYFIAFVPLGGIALLVLLAQPSKPEGARFDGAPLRP